MTPADSGLVPGGATRGATRGADLGAPGEDRLGDQPDVPRRACRVRLVGWVGRVAGLGVGEGAVGLVLPEYLVAPGGLREPERVVGSAQGVPQVAHPRGGDLQRRGGSRAAQAEVEFHLPGRQPLPRGGLQRLQLGVVVRRADVLNVPRPAP